MRNALFLPGLRSAAIAAAALAVTGCSVATPPRVSSTQKGAPPTAAVRFEPVGPASDERDRLASALQAALAARGIAEAADAATTITIAVARRPAAMGVTQDNAPSPAGVRWLSTPRKRQLFDGCTAQRLEAVVTAKPDTAATLAYSGRGGFDYCTLDPASLDDLAGMFAAEITAS